MVHIRSMGPNQIRAVVFWLVLVFFSIVMISKLGVQSLAGSVQRGRFSKPAGVGLTVLQRMAKSEKAWRSKLQERLRIMKMTPTFDDFPL